MLTLIKYMNFWRCLNSFLSRSMGVWVLILSIISLVCLSSGGLPRFEHHPTNTNTNGEGTQDLKFLVVGDWGRKGHYNQSVVASQMGRIGTEMDIEFVVSTGDNFYDDGLKGEDDPAFLQSFTNIYTADSLQKPWFNVLGNHDYRGDVLAQLSPALNKIDSRWLCLRSFVVDAGIGELFFVDTTPFVRKYFTHPKDHTYDWRGVLPVHTYLIQLSKDLDEALKASNARWKIVVGHHPIRSVGHHGDTQELLDQLLPILQANCIDLYINGHDHCLEHISDPARGIEYLTSGGGSKAWRGGYNPDVDNLKFYYDGQGFMSVQLTQTHAKVIFYDVLGGVRHKWTVSKKNKEMLHPIL